MKYPSQLNSLIACLKKFPGVGNRSAERFAFDLLDWSEEDRKTLATIVDELGRKIQYCSDCGSILLSSPCPLCNTSVRNSHTLCIVSSPKDVFAIEETGFNGLYHVIGPLLSPIDGMTPEKLRLDTLKVRLVKHSVKEIILAFDSTIEGDATALYLGEELEEIGVQISKLALGMPMGTSLDFLDGNTLSFALKGRRKI